MSNMKMRLLIICGFLLVFGPKLMAQTLTGTPTVTPAGPYCAGSSVTVNWAISGPFGGGNVFSVELSTSAGGFPGTVIATVTSTNATSLSGVVLPAASATGANYQVRILASNPSRTGTASAAFTINQPINAPTFTGAPFCQGNTFNVNYTLGGGCTFNAGNVFTAQLSDATGSFSTFTSIGTLTSQVAGAIPVAIPTSAGAGTAYRIRVVSSNPVYTGPQNATAFTIRALGINAPTVPASPYCQGQNINVAYTVQNTCNYPTGNVFTAQLSDASGSFASPQNMGSVTSTTSGNISAVIPSTPAGTGYRIRVVSSLPSVVVGADNGANITINASAGNPNVAPTSGWNAYVYNSLNYTNYVGFYTETSNLSFNSTTRWATANGPAVADGSSGSAYAGCPLTNVSNWSLDYKKTGFACGYYQIDIPNHDDDLTILIDGSQVYSAPYSAGALNNVWRGFIGPTTIVDVRVVNTGGPGSLAATFTALPSPITTSPDVTICNTGSTTLTATAPMALNYAWTPLGNLSPSNGLGTSVVASPTTTTLYTVTGTDATTGCTVNKTVNVTVNNATPTIGITASGSTTICSGIASVTLTATGANTYTWSPTTGIVSTSPSGHQVTISNLGSSVMYTVTGNNGCTNGTNTITVNGQTIPPTPDPNTVYGSGQWNAYCYNGSGATPPYYGYYTESALNFSSNSKWNTNNGPTVSNPTYNGCTFGGTDYTIRLRRTNFTCGYYQIDIPYHDDLVTVTIDGNQVFTHATCCDSHTNVWTGFLGPSSRVEIMMINNAGPGRIDANVALSAASAIVIPASTSVCSGYATLQATSPVSGVTYSWLNSSGNTSNITSPTAATTLAGPITANENFTVTITDPVTGCTATRTYPVTFTSAHTVTVTPTSVNGACAGAGPYTLTASGSSTYTWSSSPAGFSASGFQVTVNPSVTTTYTVTGYNNCTTATATATVNVPAVPAYTTFPTGTWNVYGFNSQTYGTNFVGYYTDNGSGTSGYNFNSTTRWAQNGAPSAANATNGQAWLGCAMTADNFTLSYKRTGFTCGIYQIDIPTHDDNFTLIINGTTVAQHNGCCDSHTNMWTGLLNSTSQVEIRLLEGGGDAYLSANFTLIPQTASTIIWNGSISNDWFTPGNWCYSSSTIPTNVLDALIPAAGPPVMPVINAAGAVTRNITINPAIAAGTYTNLINAASLTTAGANGLDVFGSWLNNGTYTANNGTINFTGSNTGNTISTNSTQTFFNLTVNKTNGITMASGTSQVGGALTLTNGIVTQNASLVVLATGSTSGASNTSYVDGPITKIGNTAFIFPTGRGNLLHTIAISNPGVATDAFTAQYFNTNPNPSYSVASRDGTLNRVSQLEYWILNRTAGTSNVLVTLMWNTNSAVLNPPNLRVARWDVGAAIWRDQGNGATTASTVQSSAAVTTFSTPNSPFTLGSTDASNPLPITLLSFTGTGKGSGVLLKWTTETEINSDAFIIEKLINKENFVSIGTVKAAGTSAEKRNYEFVDDNVTEQIGYYRLRMMDIDGTFALSKTIAVQMDIDRVVTVSPNPTSGKISVEAFSEKITALSIFDLQGKTLNEIGGLSSRKYEIDLSSLPLGMYFVKVITEQNTYLKRVILAR